MRDDDLSRRRFLQLSATLAAAGFAGPLWLRAGSLFDVIDAEASGTTHKLLVMLLAGGNDGLNTVVPYGMGTYYSRRSTRLTIPQNEVLKLKNSSVVGLHPSLGGLKSAYDAGKVAIIQGVGYDEPELSHFGSMDVWQSASPKHAFSSGWLGRWLDRTEDHGSVVRAVAIGDYLPQALMGDAKAGVAIPSLSGFRFWDGADASPTTHAYRLHQSFLKCADAHPGDSVAAALLAADRNSVAAVRAIQSMGHAEAPPVNSIADQVSMAMLLLNSNLGVDVAFVTLGSFDDHASEKGPHASLLGQVDQAITRFQDEAKKTGQPQNFLLATFSEFGRRVEENGSGGTDHGSSGPMFVVGDQVKGGLYGEQSQLDKPHLDANGNMKRQVEFREVYSTLLDGWLEGAGAKDVLHTGSTDGLHPLAFLK